MQCLKTQSQILDACAKRGDSWGEDVASRVRSVVDLSAAEVRYHRTCFSQFMKQPTTRSTGRPLCSENAKALQRLCEYIQEGEECQFSLQELQTKMKEFLPENAECTSDKWLKKQLLDYFGDRLVVTSYV